MMVSEVGNGVGASLRGVDCIASDMAQAAFGRLFGSQGALVPALTIILTLYVALFAFALITGRTRIGIRALTPRIVTLGMVLTFATSWIAYQSVVWNLVGGAPDQIAAILTGAQGSATQQFGDKIDIVFAAIQQASGDGVQAAQQQAQQGGGGAPVAEITTFSPKGMMWMGATLLLLGTVGVLVTAKIALAVLMAVGPIFVVLALFPATRGLFAGWLRGMVMLAIAPLFAVLGGTLMLEMAVPVINALSPVPGQIDARAAMAFFLVGAVHVALMVLVMKTAGTMVAGWRVFGMGEQSSRDSHAEAAPTATLPAPAMMGYAPGSSSSQPVPEASRRIAISGIAAGIAANDSAAATSRTITHTSTHHDHQGGQQSALQSSISRARGIGSRFRAPPARSTEKLR